MEEAVNETIAKELSSWSDGLHLLVAKEIIGNSSDDKFRDLYDFTTELMRNMQTPDEMVDEIKEILRCLEHEPIRAVVADANLLLESPCKTPECLEDCSVKGVKDEKADV